MIMMMTMMMGVNVINDNAGDDVAAQGSSQMSGNNATLTRALSAESLLSQTTVASPKFCRGQFHIHSHFSDIHKMMTMTSFAITLYGQCCRRHIVGQPVVSDISVVRSC